MSALGFPPCGRNVTFDAFDEDFSESGADLGDSVLTTGTFAGWTVYELLAGAERALGGCGSQYTFFFTPRSNDLGHNAREVGMHDACPYCVCWSFAY